MDKTKVQQLAKIAVARNRIDLYTGEPVLNKEQFGKRLIITLNSMTADDRQRIVDRLSQQQMDQINTAIQAYNEGKITKKEWREQIGEGYRTTVFSFCASFLAPPMDDKYETPDHETYY